MTIPSYFKLKGDPVIWIVFLVLCAISLVEVFSAGSTLAYKENNFWMHFIKQGGFLFAGFIVCILVHHIPCNIFKFVPMLLWPFLLFFLFLARLSSGVNGASRWVSLGVNFQPSELAKGVLICTVALVLSKFQDENGARKEAFKWICCLSLPYLFLIFTENFSTAGLLGVVVFIMMILGRVPVRQLFYVVAGLAVAAMLFVGMMFVLPKDSENAFYKESAMGSVLHRFPVWRERLTNDNMVLTASPDSFRVTDENRQEVHARIAVSNCNKGFGRAPGNSVERDYLSQAYSDFIFAIVVEELGLGGAFLVIMMYLILLFRAGMIADKCGKNFPAFLCMGLSIQIVLQAMINMMVAVGLFPVTGQTLPLISRGGTSTLVVCAYFGVILSISRYAQQQQKKRQDAREAKRQRKALAQAQAAAVIAEDNEEIAQAFANDEGMN